MNKQLKIKLRKIIIFLIMLIFIITFFTLFKIFYDNSIKQNPIYNSDIDIKYQVNNSNDSFYNSDISGQNEFISSIAKTIDLEINYKFQSDVDINYDYINKLNPSLVVYTSDNSENNILWQKDLDLVEPLKGTENKTNNFILTQKITLDYETYNNLLLEYKSKYKVPIKAYIVLNGNVYLANEVLSSISNNYEIKIPLTESTFNIILTKNKITNEQITLNKIKNLNYKLIFILSFLMLISLYILIKYYLFYHQKHDSKSAYENLINNYLQKYAQIIVEVEDKPDLKNIKVLRINNFNDLIDLEEEIQIPIFLYQDKINYKAYFYIIHGGYLYLFFITI